MYITCWKVRDDKGGRGNNVPVVHGENTPNRSSIITGDGEKGRMKEGGEYLPEKNTTKCGERLESRR